MPTTKLSVKTNDGVADCQLHTPEGPGPFPGVIYLSDAFGISPGAVQMAERLASNGYAVLVPNLFYRAGHFAPFDPASVWSDNSERARLMSIMGPANQGAIADLPAYIDALAQQPGVRAARVGLVGYCMGGRLGLLAAEAYPDRVAAVACIHGGNLVTDAPESPHLHVGKVSGRLYFGVADEDRSCTPEHQAKLEAALKAAGVRYQLEFYPGAKHGFAVPGMPVFDATAAERHWGAVLKLFKEELQAAPH
jgi:carboxymethylenebutenolidase